MLSRTSYGRLRSVSNLVAAIPAILNCLSTSTTLGRPMFRGDDLTDGFIMKRGKMQDCLSKRIGARLCYLRRLLKIIKDKGR